MHSPIALLGRGQVPANAYLMPWLVNLQCTCFSQDAHEKEDGASVGDQQKKGEINGESQQKENN